MYGLNGRYWFVWLGIAGGGGVRVPYAPYGRQGFGSETRISTVVVFHTKSYNVYLKRWNDIRAIVEPGRTRAILARHFATSSPLLLR